MLVCENCDLFVRSRSNLSQSLFFLGSMPKDIKASKEVKRYPCVLSEELMLGNNNHSGIA